MCVSKRGIVNYSYICRAVWINCRYFFFNKPLYNYDTDYKPFWSIQTMSYPVLSIEWIRTNGSLPAFNMGCGGPCYIHTFLDNIVITSLLACMYT